MKRLLIITLILLIVSIFLVACNGTPQGPRLSVNKTSLEFSNNISGQDNFEDTFTIKTEDATEAIPYEINSDATWFTVSPNTGDATPIEETITVTVNEPSPTEDKQDTILIESSMEGIDTIEIDVTFTYTPEKDDVYALLFSYPEGGETGYAYITQEGTPIKLTASGANSFTANFIEYDYDFGSETGDVYVYGEKSDFSGNDSVVIWENGIEQTSITVQHPDPATPTAEVEAMANSGGHNGVKKCIGVMDGNLHLIVYTFPKYNENFTHYWNQVDGYPTLQAPTGAVNFEVHGLVEIGGDIYIFGYETETTSWASHELKPLVWKNDGTGITLIDGFPDNDSIAGTLQPGGYRDFTPKDIAISSTGEILFVAFFGQCVGSTYDNPSEDFYYTGIFKSDGTYEPVGPNNGVYGASGSTDDQPMMIFIANDNDYIRALRGESREDEIYLDGQLVDDYQKPENYVSNPTKAIGWAKMQSDGETTYMFGQHQYTNQDSFYTNNMVLYRGTKLIIDKNTYNIDGTDVEGLSSLDADFPERP